MAIFKCKMCGGTLEINDETVAECQYCGTKQTLPKLDDDRKANLYDRANHFRRNNEFDKAMSIYEQILNDDNTDAETYWSLVLCRYGIEYVEDPSSHKRVPTVNRAQFTSIFDDEDYKSALRYADSYQKEVYEQEAIIINNIQKGILAISSQEEPFDVFICYKESDSSGCRTPDSVLATELYHELTREGYKVFFSRITLEDKLGTAYEPYIFAALNSAKVMVVLGTKPEFFNAVWVKNEWSRYLALIKNGARKMLIPAYKDMDPYDLPEEFSHLQAQDMSKLGFMQDLIRGIKKIVENNTDKPVVREAIISNEIAGSISALLKRGFMALEDGEWSKADNFFEQCLNQDAELAEAYLGKLMAELQVKTQDGLKDGAEPFEDRSNYQKAVRFANHKLKAFLVEVIQFINRRNEDTAREETYNRACNLMSLNNEAGYLDAVPLFEKLSGYKDADALAEECRKNAEVAHKDRIYKNACDVLNGTYACVGQKTDIKALEKAIAQLQSLNGWKDSEEKILLCQKKIEEIKSQLETERIEQEKRRVEEEKQNELNRIAKENAKKRTIKIAAILIPFFVAVVVVVIILNTVVIPNSKYNDAISLINEGRYVEANNILLDLDNYKDSLSVRERIKNNVQNEILKTAKVGDTVKYGLYEQDNDTKNGKEEIEWIVLSQNGEKALLISRYILDNQKFNSSYDNHTNTWSDSAIRIWLNNEFKNTAFNNSETAIICDTTINENSTTKDKIFLLSIEEANRYFKSDDERRCENTEYSKYHFMADKGKWWLRTKNDFEYATYKSSNVAVVHFHGAIGGEDTGYLDEESTFYCGVRPAMWIDLSSIN